MAVKRRFHKNPQRSAQTRSATSLKGALHGIESTLAQVTDDLGRVERLAADADLRSRIALGKVRGEPPATAEPARTEDQSAEAAMVARPTLLQRLNDVGAQADESQRALLYLFEKVRALYERLGVEWGEELEPATPYEPLSL